jgi:hypothetical protein
VAWSWPGLALGAAAMLAFVARTPLKLVLVDRWRGRWLPRTTLAARVAAVELAGLSVLVALAAIWSADRFWPSLLAAAPLVAIELWFDMHSRSRRLLPELAGTIGIGAVAATIALAGGETTAVALGLWTVIAARAAAAIPYARTQVLRAHGKAQHVWHSDLAQACSALAVTVGWLLGAVPGVAVLAVTALGAFNVAAVRAASRPAKVIGLQQLFAGIAVIAITAFGVTA